MAYEKPFWSEDCDEINLIRAYEHKSKLIDELKHKWQVAKEHAWLRDVFLLEPSSHDANVLIVWMGGSHEHESLSDDEITRGINSLIIQFMPHLANDLPNPKQIIR